MGQTEKIILFSRFPVPGKAKTRLIPALGPHKAAMLQKWMTERAADRAAEAARCRKASLEIRFTGGDQQQMRQWLGSGPEYVDQGPGDLGARLERSFTGAFAGGFSRVVLIGADCPGLTTEHIVSALEHLHENDLVLGPSRDGGYYLIGLGCNQPRIFEKIPWGSDRVSALTLERADACSLKTRTLEELSDVDHADDLAGLGDYPLP